MLMRKNVNNDLRKDPLSVEIIMLVFFRGREKNSRKFSDFKKWYF